jgi:hypothetical protein
MKITYNYLEIDYNEETSEIICVLKLKDGNKIEVGSRGILLADALPQMEKAIYKKLVELYAI